MGKIKAGLSGETVISPVVRLSYAHLFVPAASEEGEEPKYSTSLLFPKDPAAAYKRLNLPEGLVAEYEKQLRAIKEAIVKLAIEAYGGREKLPEEILQQDLRKCTAWPFRDQGQKDGDAYERGALFVNVSSKRPPQIIDPQLRRILPAGDALREALGREGKLSPLTPDDVFSGCWARVSVRPFSYENKGNAGISLGLGNVQLVCKDDSLGGGGASAENEFASFASSPSSGGDLSDILG